MIEIAEVAFDSEEYRRTLELRDRILRRPLGLVLSASDVKGEERQFHLVAFDDDTIVGCLVLVPGEAGRMRMRQVAVAETAQRRGVGTALVRRAEGLARELGFREMVLHARRVAVPFYERLGYRAEGPEFVEVTSPHFLMRKAL